MRDGLGRLQRVVLLGGTSDIGLAVVERLVDRRDVREVVLAGRDGPRLRRAAEVLRGSRARPPSVEVVALDATDPAERIAADVDRALAVAPDVVVHAIGMLPHDDRSGTDPVLAGRVLDVNTRGSGVMLLRAAACLRHRGHGTLVALSSVAAVRARPDNLVYGASKAGYDALARGLADVLDGSGAQVMVVRPGYVRSRMTATHPEAPLACDPADVARAVDAALDRTQTPWWGPVVWVPPTMALVGAAIRVVPARMLTRVADRLAASGSSPAGNGGPPSLDPSGQPEPPTSAATP